ncbi:MAG TPA: SUMF1/EgtB/PvdO family nonheme iron enzyme [Pirellulales bacterium]
MTADVWSPVLEIGAWDAATSEARLIAARAVAESLGPAYSFAGLATYSLGNQTREVAQFTYDGVDFVLTPGASAALLGYDRAQPFRPTASQNEEWSESLGGTGWALSEYLNAALTPLRRTSIPPLLVEVAAQRFAYSCLGDSQADAFARVTSSLNAPFRLPTADEWEYLCAAGTRTLFRWGDDSPPTNSESDRSWTGHCVPNAFGLLLNSSTYTNELCEGPTLRGGDGGCAVCGGASGFATWVPFASSFAMPDEEVAGWYIDDVVMRRVRTIHPPFAE